MAQIRDYVKGQFETQTLVPIGQITDSTDSWLSKDGVLHNAFSGLVLYTDSAGTAPIPGGDGGGNYASTTQDTAATAKEADTGGGGSGDTVYAQFEIINATYQNVDLWATFENFGTYTSNDAPFDQQGGKTEVAATTSIEIPEGYHKYRVKIDTTAGDVALTIGNGQFDGQQILLKETGNGNKSRIIGPGFYAGADSGGMYLVNRSILCTWNADDSLWEMDDCVVAEWVESSIDIRSYAKGDITEGSALLSKNNGVTSEQLFSFPFSFQNAPILSVQQNATSLTTMIIITTQPNAAQFGLQVIGIATGAASAGVREFTFLATGTY